MDTTRAYKFRLYPDSKRQSEIDLRIVLAQKLYNKILEKAIAGYKANRNSRANKSSFNRYMKEAIAENNEFLLLYSQTRQNIFVRLHRAYQNFFRRVKAKKEKAGFPRFKSRDFYNSITYPQDNGSFRIEKDMLRISRIGRMRIELHRPIAGKIKTLTIKKEAGKYYAIFSTVADIEIPKVQNTNPVGIDVGLKTFAALSDGTKIQKPNFRKDAQKHIAIWQKRVARKRKGSKNRQKAKLKLQLAYQKANGQTNDWLQKTATALIKSGYTSFAMEDLRITNMLQDHRLARSIQDASWGKFRELLSYKAESASLGIVLVDARNTSKTCANCGSMKEMPLSARAFRCDTCGYSNDRDINASINILKRATAGHAGSNASGDAASTMQRASQVASLNQEHTLHKKEWYP